VDCGSLPLNTSAKGMTNLERRSATPTEGGSGPCTRASETSPKDVAPTFTVLT